MFFQFFFQHFALFNNKIDIFQALRTCVLLFVINPCDQKKKKKKNALGT